MKYIAYCRKSTDEKDKQVLSIEAQADQYGRLFAFNLAFNLEG